jgi:UDP-N-acetylmuramoyl-L-alanyl-D-glutamate--2,6-diaminopimelate ligase
VPSPAPPRPAAVPPRPLSALAAEIGAALDPAAGPAAADARVTGVTLDSRAVRPGDLYAALPGSRAHGADFAGQAVAAGAAAILTDPAGQAPARAAGVPVLVVPDPRARLGAAAAWVYGEPARDLLLLGFTGTNGKTTTAYLAEAGLRAAGHRTGLVGTVETRVAGEVFGSVRTTPEAPDLQALFAVMRERGVTAAAMEVSSHALAMGRVDGTVYDVAVFTNLSQDHLDFHGDLEAYFAAKAELFTPERSRAAVVNVDDPYGRRLAARLAEAGAVPVTTFSASGRPDADWRAEGVQLGPQGSTLRAAGPDGRLLDAAVGLPGPFNVDNALAALVALVVAGVPAEAAAAGVAGMAGVPGRMERIEAGQPYLAVVDYAHTPDAVETLLAALREVTKGRLAVVVGCGGDRDRDKRPLMGAAAARQADLAVLTNDNPRSEDPLAILAAMRAGADTVPAGQRAEVVVEPDRAAAIGLAVARAGAGDTVVVAGKGHEQGQEAGGVVRPFDDRRVLRAAIEARHGHGGSAGGGRAARSATGGED